MEKFVTLHEAKQLAKMYMDYIILIETYEPVHFHQHAIKAYALEGSLKRAADRLNRTAAMRGIRRIEPEHIAEAILSEPLTDDILHKEIAKLYRSQRAKKRPVQQDV